jgi:hypothetical protein
MGDRIQKDHVDPPGLLIGRLLIRVGWNGGAMLTVNAALAVAGYRGEKTGCDDASIFERSHPLDFVSCREGAASGGQNLNAVDPVLGALVGTAARFRQIRGLLGRESDGKKRVSNE